METLSKLSNYILNNEKIIKISNNNFYNESKKKETKKKENIVTQKDLYIPDVKDMLFWCFYICNFSFESYELLSHSKFKEEKEFKIRFINDINFNKQLLKQIKIKYSRLENSLVNENKIDLYCFYALCAFYKLNILLFGEKVYYNFNFSDTKDYCLLKITKDLKIGIENKENNINKVEYIKNNFVEVSPIKNKLFAPSYYSRSELEIIAKKLHVNIFNEKTQKNKRKDALYEDVYQEINKYILLV